MRQLRLIHEGAEVLEVAGQQVGCLTGKCCLKDRLVFFRKAFEVVKASPLFRITSYNVCYTKLLRWPRLICLARFLASWIWMGEDELIIGLV